MAAACAGPHVPVRQAVVDTRRADAAVDATAEAAIYHDLIANRPAGTTVIVISHRPRVLTGMDRIIVLDHGHVNETGTYRQLVDSNGTFSRLAHDSLE